MKYVIVHLIRGEAGKLHQEITRALTERFGTYPLYDYVPPHLTLKRSFEIDESRVSEIYSALETFVSNHIQTNYELKGFGNFGSVAVYIEALASPEMQRDHTELQNILSEIDGITLDEFDKAQRLHATVALQKLKPFDLDQIWNYIQTLKQPRFSMKFDNVALLKKVDDRWHVEKVFELHAHENA